MATFYSLPTEILDEIVDIAGYDGDSKARDLQTLRSLCLVSKEVNAVASRCLYQQYREPQDKEERDHTLRLFLRTICKRPDIALNVKEFTTIQRREPRRLLSMAPWPDESRLFTDSALSAGLATQTVTSDQPNSDDNFDELQAYDRSRQIWLQRLTRADYQSRVILAIGLLPNLEVLCIDWRLLFLEDNVQEYSCDYIPRMLLQSLHGLKALSHIQLRGKGEEPIHIRSVLPLIRKPGLKEFMCKNMIGERGVHSTLSDADFIELQRRRKNANLTLEAIRLYESRIDTHTIASLICDCAALRSFCYWSRSENNIEREDRDIDPADQFDTTGIVKALSLHKHTIEFLALHLLPGFEDPDVDRLRLNHSLKEFSRLEVLLANCILSTCEPEDTLVQMLPASTATMFIFKPNIPLQQFAPYLDKLAAAGREQLPNLRSVIYVPEEGFDDIKEEDLIGLKKRFSARDVNFFPLAYEVFTEALTG